MAKKSTANTKRLFVFVQANCFNKHVFLKKKIQVAHPVFLLTQYGIRRLGNLHQPSSASPIFDLTQVIFVSWVLAGWSHLFKLR